MFSDDSLIMLQLCLNHFVKTYDLTIEDFYHKQIVIDQELCMMKVLNMIRQKKYSVLRNQ